MICYRCGEDAGFEQVCPGCGADLKIFQKVVSISNAYYNDGYDKACVRNLSGAILSLKKCLKLNKYHTQARNLLGLIYYEMGEYTDAIAEWVISTSLQTDTNEAARYLVEIHRRTELEQIRSITGKYNQAVSYLQQGNRDLAEIQLKKAVSLNPKFVRGHQMLSLLYLETGQLEKCKKQLRMAGRVDTDNTLTLKYLREVNQQLREKNSGKARKDDDLLMYQNGNEMIIMPKRFRENSLRTNLFYLLGGLVLGILVVFFLVVPSVRSSLQLENQQQIADTSDRLSTNDKVITDLEEQVASLQEQLDTAQASGTSNAEEITQYQKFLEACSVYYTGSVEEAGNALLEVETEYLEPQAQETYQDMWNSIYKKYMKSLFESGCKYYNKNKYEKAIAKLLPVVTLDEEYKDGEAAYYLAMSFEKNGDTGSAYDYFLFVAQNYPDTEHGKTAAKHLNDEQ